MRYDAFISYRHSELDMHVAKKLHKGLETFRVPRAVAKKAGKKNIKRVFRDQEELPIGSDLGDNIETALEASEFLIVVCSPRTPESYWVQKEISTFIQMHGREHVLAVLIEGEPCESFPEQLLTDDEGNPVEPLAADVRGSTRGEVNRKLKTELMRLAAPLLHCSYDDLRQRHRERKIKRMAAVFGMAAVVAILFGAYSTYNAALIQQNYEGKQRNESKYLADTSLSLLEEGDRRAAVLVALEALPSEDNNRPYVAEAQYALSQALQCYDNGNRIKMDRVLQHELPVKNFFINQEGSRVLSVDQGNTIYVWDVEDGTKLAQIAPRTNESGYMVEPIAAIVEGDHIIICEENMLRSISFDGQTEWQTDLPASVFYCLLDETAKMAACVNRDEVLFFDLTDGTEIDRMDNLQETSYSAEMAFNEDRTKFVVSHMTSDENAVAGCVSVYDFATKEITDVTTTDTYISELAFTAEDNLAVAQCNYNDLTKYNTSTATGYIQVIDYQNQVTVWQDSYEYQAIGTESTSACIKCRSYQNQKTGEEHNEVMLSMDNAAYTWDAKTGEKIVEMRVDSGIMNLLVSKNSYFGYLAQKDGSIEIVNMTDGTRYSDATIETDQELRQVEIRTGIIAMRAYASPNLTIMKYPETTGMVELETYESAIRNMDYSKEESYYAVTFWGTGTETGIRFYETDGNTFVEEWKEADSSLRWSGFVDDTTYALACMDGTVTFCNLQTGERETLELGEEFYCADYSVNTGTTVALAYCDEWYGVLNLEQRKIVFSAKTEDCLRGGIISEDGRKIYCSTRNMGVCILDAQSGSLTPIDIPEYEVLRSTEEQDAFAISRDGNLLAVSCRDGMLRVLDVKAMKTVAEVPFAGISRRFIQFSEDNRQVMLQGDDYYFRVYDLDKGEFTHISTNQYYEINKALMDEKSGTVCLVTMVNMVILNSEDYERIALVDGGKAYLPEHGLVWSNSTWTIYQFPFMTLDMLQKEAEEQFGGEELTKMEKIKYHVE